MVEVAPFPDGDVKFHYKPDWIDLTNGDPHVMVLYCDGVCSFVYHIDDERLIEVAGLYHHDE